MIIMFNYYVFNLTLFKKLFIDEISIMAMPKQTEMIFYEYSPEKSGQAI